MKSFKVPAFLHDVLGEENTVFSVALIALVTLSLSGALLYLDSFTLFERGLLSGLIVLILIADIFAGTIANFTKGTNNFYANRPKNRWLFIAIHFQPVLIGWLLGYALGPFIQIWLITIVSAILVNITQPPEKQRVLAASLTCIAIFLGQYFFKDMPLSLFAMAIFYSIKVIFSFGVNHEGQYHD